MTFFRINLIRNRLAKNRRQQTVFAAVGLSTLIWFTLIAYMLTAYAAGNRRMDSLRKQIAVYQDKTSSIRRLMPEIEMLETEKAELEKILTEADSVLDRRSHWAQVLQAIAECVPNKTWITEVRCNSQNDSDFRERIKGGSDSSPAVRVSATALCHSDDTASPDPATEFLSALDSHPLLKADVKEIRLAGSEREIQYGFPVRQLKVTVMLRSGRQY